MAEPTISKIQINNIPLKCTVCGHDEFSTRKTLLNTKGLTFFGLDWANEEALNYICSSCGFIHWFIDQG
ncbi:MAG: hypothetical protein COA43_05570 [Robiginitomaculum sp.]|nr:MAG: hypothetical protein COA43_05570 [Robiginitomaculum sp.]